MTRVALIVRIRLRALYRITEISGGVLAMIGLILLAGATDGESHATFQGFLADLVFAAGIALTGIGLFNWGRRRGDDMFI